MPDVALLLQESEIIATNYVNVQTINESDKTITYVWDNEKRATSFYRDQLYAIIRQNKK